MPVFLFYHYLIGKKPCWRTRCRMPLRAWARILGYKTHVTPHDIIYYKSIKPINQHRLTFYAFRTIHLSNLIKGYTIR